MEEWRNKNDNIQKTNSKMEDINPTSSIMTLNANELSTPSRDQQNERFLKRSNYMLFIRDTLLIQETKRLKVKGWKKIHHANSNQKRAVGVILTADKADFKTKLLLET